MKEFIVPDELRFAITRKCDGNCRHCYNQSGSDIDKLSSDDFNKLLKEVHVLNPKLDRITLTGGEPLLEKDKVLEIARFAKALDIRVRLVTRGWGLTRGLCRELKEAGVTRLQIGLDSSGNFGYEDDLKKTWETFHSWLRDDEMGFIKTVDAIRTAVGAGLDVSVRFSLCRSNLNDVVKTYRFVSSLGVSKFKFRILFPDGRAKSRLLNELISGREMADAQYDLVRASIGNQTVVEVTQPCSFKLPPRARLVLSSRLPNAYKESCPCGTTAAYIDANGDVKYCLFDERVLGNVSEDSFLSVWNSVSAKNAREQRCPLDRSGNGCSSFKLLYQQFNDYSGFMHAYQNYVAELMGHFSQ